MINNILLNGKIVNLEKEEKDNVSTILITRVWFEGDKVNLTTESLPYNQEEYEAIRKEAYENAVKFVALMSEREKKLEAEKNVEAPVVEETVFERLLRETSAGTVWVNRALEATNNNYEASLQYLFERGLYNQVPAKKELKKEEVVVNKDETVFEKLMRETQAGAIWVGRALEASNNDYRGALEYLVAKGFYDASKLPAEVIEQPVVEEKPVVAQAAPVKEEPVVQAEQVVEEQPKKNKLYSKLVKYGLAAALFFGGFSLVKNNNVEHKLEAANDPKTEEIVDQKLVEHNISTAEFLNASVEIADYLTEKGLETSSSEVYSTLYLANMNYFEEAVLDELTNSELKILSNSSKNLIEDSLGLLASIDTFNGKIVEESTNITEEELRNKLISLKGFILSNQKDLDNLDHIEDQLVSMTKINDKNEYSKNYMDVFNYFSGANETKFPHSSNDGSIGGRYLQKTIGSQINQFSRKFMDKNALMAFEIPITDLNNEIGYLNDCGFTFNSLTK